MDSDNRAHSRSEDDARRYKPESEYHRSLVSLRWLIVILASYLTLFSRIPSGHFPLLFGFSIIFATTNIGLWLVTDDWFQSRTGQRVTTILDIFFISGTIYLLRIPNTYLYVAFIMMFVLAEIWRDLKLLGVSLLVVSVLYGVFNYYRIAGFALDVNIEQFLTLSLFFLVSIFYVFLCQQFGRYERLSRSVLEEKRNADIIVEITRGLSSSLHTQDVLRIVVDRLCDVFHATDCSIIGIDSKSSQAYMLVRSGDPSAQHIPIDLNLLPELKEAYENRKMAISNRQRHNAVAVPMVAQDKLLGLIHVVRQNDMELATEARIRFFEVMASTAANALRNAQLFEEVEHRARTDFLTGLPNHRYFQATLSAELGRAQRHNHQLSLLMIDLDYLKIVNDRFGHPTGDMVIRTIAETIRQSCREFDFAARYGGEEFTVILPETDLSGAIHVADRIRERIAEVHYKGVGTVTASIGVSNYPINSLNKEDLIRVADQALYLAKNGGRDRVAYFSYQLVK